MFKWIKNKINKRKHREHYNAIGQCGSFLTYAMSFTENNKLEKYSSLYPLLSIKNKILDKISRKFKKELLNTTDANELMSLNKDCRILYDKHFNWTGKSFDEEYAPVIIKTKGDID